MRAILFTSALCLILTSCIKNNPDPSWVQVNEWTLEANAALSIGEEGVLTHKVTDAWLYVNNELIGVFEVPFKVPVLTSGASEIRIFPTVRNNGISSSKKIYPFLEEYKIEVDLIQNEVLVVNPVTRYKVSSQFQIYDFEDASLHIQEGSESTAIMQIVDENDEPDIFDPNVNGGIGGHWGQIHLTQTNSIYIGSSDFQSTALMDMTLPKGEECYLEIDYYTTAHLYTGVLAVTPSGNSQNPLIRINAQDPATIGWNKIYIDLREVISYYQDAQYYEFTFDAELDGASEAKINIDNIKAVHF